MAFKDWFDYTSDIKWKTSESLVDRDCVLLDGDCKCNKPYEDCKYIEKETELTK